MTILLRTVGRVVHRDVMNIDPALRDGDTGDAEVLAALFLRSRSWAMP